MSIFNVELKKVVDDSYDIEVGYKLSDKLVSELTSGAFAKVKKFAIITDSTVVDLYANRVYEAIKEAGFTADLFVFPAGEKSKTREVKARIEDEMLAKGYRRDCMIVAIGGGVVTDLAGFIAGTYGRGVPFVNYATTLLAAADASVGGKTAVDTPLATNLIGLFNQPKKVYIDIDCWKTLDARLLADGMAETIKHACLADKALYEFLYNNMDKIYAGDSEACEFIAKRNCEIKYNVVMKDERESGLREILNLGHTVGRAIETCSDYVLLHGEAVAIGLVAQAMLSESKGYMTGEQVESLVELLKKANLPTTIPEYINREELVKKLYTDKKVRDGKLRFVLQKGVGDIVCFGDNVYATPVSEDEARAIIMKM